MLMLYGSHHHGPMKLDPDEAVPADVNWIDALEPSPEELRILKQAIGTRVPTLADLSEIESSSRLSSEGSTLFMSLPATTRDGAGFPETTPIGFILTRERLATIRFARLPSFENLTREICAKGDVAEGGLGAMVTILEIIVDHLADVLEHVGGELDGMSRQVFTRGLVSGRDRRPHKANQVLTQMLKTVGENGDLVSKVSESLLGLSRIVPFLGIKAQDLMTPAFKTRLETVNQDAKSLREFEEHLSNKTQFLLDTLLGLANIEQNNVFRVLTVVSVVGIPPTFFASMYGMNFKNMPEYDWAFGYQYGLTLIILSGLLPALWFKIKGWW